MLAFERYKLTALEFSLGGGFLEDDERHDLMRRAVDGAREECDVAVLAMVEHRRSHRETMAEVIVMPVR